ncbi:MAG TPA: DUF2461 domain-containing protein [Gemmatimonadales bacterium]|jgi:uncharacterized protein (TIGR02453 family)|nr:DUF2461 domain-containing protein [Gemmatimonadales bacterium]
MSFTPAALRFFKDLRRHNAKRWFEAHKEAYQNEVVLPMRALIEELDVRFARSAPEITGDPKKSMFRIYRDIRFSRDKAPYKVHAACWFWHKDADPRVGDSAESGSAGFYFHLEPGASAIGAGIWKPPRPLLNKVREYLAEKPATFEKVVKSPAFKRRFGGLDKEGMLKRVPRGFDPDHRAGEWLKYQSFTAGRSLSDREVASENIGALLEKDFVRLLPLVRWLNGALGLKAAAHR